MTASEFSDVFVSYRRTDVEFVKQLVESLQKEGKEVWVDWEDIPPGSVGFTEDIKRGLEGADAFICVLSPKYLESTYCVDLELGYAADLSKRIIPIVYEKFDGDPVPDSIGHINWIYFTPHAGQANTYEESFPKVLEALESDLNHLRHHKRFLLRAIEWDTQKRQNGYLIDGAELEAAEDWLTNAAGKDPIPTQLQKDFIGASRENKIRRQRMLLTGVSVAFVFSLFLMILSAYLGYQARLNSNQAETQAAIANQNAEAATIAQGKAEDAANNALTQQANAYDSAATAIVAQEHAEEQSTVAAVAQAQAEDLAREIQSLFLADAGTDALGEGNPYIALALVQAAIEHDDPPQAEVLVSYANVVYEPGPHQIIDMDAESIVAMALSPDERHLLTSRCLDDSRECSNWDLTVWNTETWHPVRTLQGQSDIPLIITFDRRGGRAVTTACARQEEGSCLESEIIIWDIGTGEIINRWNAHDAHISSLAYSDDAAFLLSTSWDNTLALWDGRRGQQIYQITPHLGAVLAASFTPDGSEILVIACDSICESTDLILLNAETGEEKSRYSYIAAPTNNSIAIDPDNPVAIFGGTDNNLVIWNYETGEVVDSIYQHRSSIKQVYASESGDQVVTVGLDREFVVWDFARKTTEELQTGTGFVNQAILINDGNQVLVASNEKPSLTLWDARSGAISEDIITTSAVTAVEPIPDSGYVFAGQYDGTLMLADMTNPEDVTTWDADSAQVYAVAVNSNGTRGLSAGCAELIDDFCIQGRVSYWDLQNQSLIAQMDGHDDWPYLVTLSSDGSLAASAANDGTVIIWDLASYEAVNTIPTDDFPYIGLSFIPDRQSLLIGTDHHLIEWDILSGEPIWEIQGQGEDYRISAFYVYQTDTGTELVVAQHQGQVIRRDLSTGEVIGQTPFSLGQISHIAITDEKLLVSSNNRVAINDLNTQVMLWEFETAGIINDMTLTHDGSLITAADTGITSWRIDTSDSLVTWANNNRVIPVLPCERASTFRLEEDCAVEKE